MPEGLTINITPAQLAAALPRQVSGDALEAVLAKLVAIEKRLDASGEILLGREQAAAAMNISTGTLDSLHDLPRVRIGTRVLVRRSAIEEWSREHEHTEAVAG